MASLLSGVLIIIIEAVVSEIYYKKTVSAEVPVSARNILVYLNIFILSQVFQFYFCVDAVMLPRVS